MMQQGGEMPAAVTKTADITDMHARVACGMIIDAAHSPQLQHGSVALLAHPVHNLHPLHTV